MRSPDHNAIFNFQDFGFNSLGEEIEHSRAYVDTLIKRRMASIAVTSTEPESVNADWQPPQLTLIS